MSIQPAARFAATWAFRHTEYEEEAIPMAEEFVKRLQTPAEDVPAGHLFPHANLNRAPIAARLEVVTAENKHALQQRLQTDAYPSLDFEPLAVGDRVVLAGKSLKRGLGAMFSEDTASQEFNVLNRVWEGWRQRMEQAMEGLNLEIQAKLNALAASVRAFNSRESRPPSL